MADSTTSTSASNRMQSTNGEADATPDLMNQTTDSQAQPSFNDQLQQFQYSSATSITAATVTNSPISTVRKRARKAIAESDGHEAFNSPSKKKRSSSKYADPSKYAHLKPLVDILEPNLICVFVGFNPGVKTATTGHAYSHPSNHFWKLVHSSGCTDRRLKPEEDVDLPRLYSMGNTNLVARPSKEAGELSKKEQLAGVPILDAKIRQYRPEAVCIVGKSIWQHIWEYRYGKKPSPAEFKFGFQDKKHNIGKLPVKGMVDDDDKDWPGAMVFVATSTSGLDASMKLPEKEAKWRPFGEWVKQRRQERAEVQQEKLLE